MLTDQRPLDHPRSIKWVESERKPRRSTETAGISDCDKQIMKQRTQEIQ